MDGKKAPAPGSLHQRAGERIKHGDSSTGFPICKLHKCAIVDRFPDGCPFAAANHMTAFLEMKKRAWSHLHPVDQSLSESLHQMSCYDVCWACFGELHTDPAVRRLRRAAQPPAEPETIDTGSARNGKPHRRPGRSPVYV